MSFPPQMDQSRWPDYKDKVAEVFKTRTRDEWCDLMEGVRCLFCSGAVFVRGA